MVHYCCCFGCNEKYVKGGAVTFHSFPKDEARKKLWVQKLRRENFSPTKYSKVCSKHFEEYCFDREKFGGVWLKPDAVPTIFNFPKHLLKRTIARKSPVKRTSDVVVNPELRAMNASPHPCTEVSADENHENPSREGVSRRRKRLLRNIGDFNEEDLSSPMKAKKILAIAQKQISEQKMMILHLRTENKKIKRKISVLENMLTEIKREAQISDDALHVLEMKFGGIMQWIKEEPQEVDENDPQDEIEKMEPRTNLGEEHQEGTDENEEEEVKRPVAVYLPVKMEEEEEEEEEELAPPVAMFLMTKEEPKEEEEDEEEVEDPSNFSDASEKREEISESSGQASAAEFTSSDPQASEGSAIGQSTREETSYHCSICQKSISKERWTMHMKIHSGEKSYQCLVCEKRFTEKVTLDVHMRIHTREKRHVCSVCQASFTQSGSLARHMRIHTGERPFQCSICEKNFYNKSNLNTHMLSHTGEKKHCCSVCQRSFSLKKNLVKHTLLHTGERPYPCSVCEKSFIQRGSLVEHMRTHTGESSNLNCSICQKSFTQRGNLNVHMRTHTGEKPHTCSICHKSFNQGGHLIRHMRMHTGEKPHNCTVCQESFNRREHLELHMQVHTS